MRKSCDLSFLLVCVHFLSKAEDTTGRFVRLNHAIQCLFTTGTWYTGKALCGKGLSGVLLRTRVYAYIFSLRHQLVFISFRSSVFDQNAPMDQGFEQCAPITQIVALANGSLNTRICSADRIVYAVHNPVCE